MHRQVIPQAGGTTYDGNDAVHRRAGLMLRAHMLT